jgi:hypothetical protein
MGNILVARKNIDFIVRQKLLSFMSMEVVSNLDSMLNPGASQSRSRQNTSILSNRMTQLVSNRKRSMRYHIFDVILVRPSLTKFDVSITSHPCQALSY